MADVGIRSSRQRCRGRAGLLAAPDPFRAARQRVAKSFTLRIRPDRSIRERPRFRSTTHRVPRSGFARGRVGRPSFSPTPGSSTAALRLTGLRRRCGGDHRHRQQDAAYGRQHRALPHLRLVACSSDRHGQHRCRRLPARAGHRWCPTSALRGNTVGGAHVPQLILALRRSLIGYREDVARQMAGGGAVLPSGHPIRDLHGSTLGISARRDRPGVAHLGRAFGMRVLFADQCHRRPEASSSRRRAGARQADVVTLHLPLTPATAQPDRRTRARAP